PATGCIDANAAQHSAASPQVIAAMRNEIQIAGPVMSPAVEAVTVKMPAPITTDTPNTQRCHQLKSLRSWVSGSSVSAIDCSIDLVRQRPAMSPHHTE